MHMSPEVTEKDVGHRYNAVEIRRKRMVVDVDTMRLSKNRKARVTVVKSPMMSPEPMKEKKVQSKDVLKLA